MKWFNAATTNYTLNIDLSRVLTLLSLDTPRGTQPLYSSGVFRDSNSIRLTADVTTPCGENYT